METSTSFNPHNMFIYEDKILNEYYKILFPWLEKCEDIFGFDKLKGYAWREYTVFSLKGSYLIGLVRISE